MGNRIEQRIEHEKKRKKHKTTHWWELKFDENLWVLNYMQWTCANAMSAKLHRNWWEKWARSGERRGVRWRWRTRAANGRRAIFSASLVRQRARITVASGTNSYYIGHNNDKLTGNNNKKKKRWENYNPKSLKHEHNCWSAHTQQEHMHCTENGVKRPWNGTVTQQEIIGEVRAMHNYLSSW